jgi:excisionase family DNA binding protein
MPTQRAVVRDAAGLPESSELGRQEVLPRLLTLPEVSKYLGVNPKTVRRWVASRRMPCVRVGTRLRFDVGDIVSWVRQRKEG